MPLHSYRLDVTIPGHEPIWAEQTMPESPGIEVGWHEFDPNWHKENPDKILFDYVGYEFRFTHANNHPVWFYGVNYKDADSSGEETQAPNLIYIKVLFIAVIVKLIQGFCQAVHLN